MKYLLGLCLLALMLLAPTASHAQDSSPLTLYLRLCEVINRADSNYTAGASSVALADYTTAQKAAQELQTKFPSWNVSQVGLRQSYITERLKLLGSNAQPMESTISDPATPKPVADASGEAKSVQAELRAAQAENASLLAKLKEALEARSNAADPIDLRQAEEQVRSLQKENDRLRTELESSTKAASAAGGDSDVKRLRKSLDEVNAKLKAQSAAAVSLLADKNLKIEYQNRQIEAFTKERAEYERRIQQASTNTPLIGDLRSENTSLKQQLHNAQTQLTNATAQATEARKQMEIAQVRLLATELNVDYLRQTNAALLKQLSSTPNLELVSRLTNENRQLKQQIAEAGTKASGARVAELERGITVAKTEIAQLNQRLTTAPSQDAVARLTTDNQTLRKQLGEAQIKVASASRIVALQETLTTTQARLAAAETTVKTTQTENTGLRQQLDAYQKTATVQAARARQLEQQISELQTRFAEVDRQLSSRNAKQLEVKIQSLNNDMLALRSRISVYEAKAIPYSKEELALFRMPAATNVVGKADKRTDPTAVTLEVSSSKLLAASKPSQPAQPGVQASPQGEREVRAFCNLALSQAASGRYQEAEENARKALAINPSDSASLGVLGQALASQNKFDEALDPLSRATTLKPNDSGMQTLLGIILAQKGQRAQAETAFRKALQASAENADAHRNLAVIYLTKQPPLVELARWHYQKSLIYRAPPSPEIESKLGPAPK